MKTLTRKLVDLPTWLVFILYVASLFLIQNSPFAGTSRYTIDARMISSYILGAFMTLWYFSVGYVLHDKMTEKYKLSIRWFVFTLIFTFGYSPIAGNILFSENFILLFPLHFFAMYSIVYIIYFIARSLVTLEDDSPVKLDRYLGTIIILWFFPIGIWFVLPRIKKQVHQQSSN